MPNNINMSRTGDKIWRDRKVYEQKQKDLEKQRFDDLRKKADAIQARVEKPAPAQPMKLLEPVELNTKLNLAEGWNKPTDVGTAYQGQDMKGANDAIQRRYDMMRSRATGDADAATQVEQDALKRRFASMGGINSGAAMKQQMLSSERGAQRAQQAREGMDMAQMQEAQQMAEADKQRSFASNEALQQRKWQGAEAAIGREFQKAIYEHDAEMKNKMFKFDQGKWGQQYDLAMKQYGLEADAQKFNMDMAERLMNQEGMLDRIGGLGTNFWKRLGAGDMGAINGSAAGGILGMGTPLGPWAGAVMGGGGL